MSTALNPFYDDDEEEEEEEEEKDEDIEDVLPRLPEPCKTVSEDNTSQSQHFQNKQENGELQDNNQVPTSEDLLELEVNQSELEEMV